METKTNELLNGGYAAAYMSGIILGCVKYNDNILPKEKKFLLEQLIKAHNLHNMGAHSKNIIDECNKLLENF